MYCIKVGVAIRHVPQRAKCHPASRLQQSLQRYAEVFVSLMINIELKHSTEYQRTVFGK